MDRADREEFLREACGSDPALFDEVVSLLEADAADHHMTGAVGEVAKAVRQMEVGLHADSVVGPYRLVREIGSGGMSTVWQAVRADDEFRITVAVKLIPREYIGSRFFLSRFKIERQILANLNHPNIAHLIDGGTTTDGIPYLVMEYIEGVPIDAFCKQTNPAIERRLEIFRDVCAAVQHAHQKLVIHRDLKPANILVGPDGTPKLLDFGIAKLLDRDFSTTTISPTAADLRLMTPQYASPEQVRAEPVTVASDVYSLGVILYELLSGHKPYRVTNASLGDMERIICVEHPEPPSKRASGRKIASDLDNIVLTALRKEPDRRYGSVDQFSEDIRRFLNSEPVRARKDTITYRFRKFVRRNRATAAAAMLAVASLVAGTAFSVYQAQRAERRFAQVRKLANTFLFDFHDKIQNLPGSTEARKMIAGTALEYLDSLQADAGSDPELLYEIASACEKVGDVQGNPTSANLGMRKEAQSSYQRGLRIADDLVRRYPRDLRFTRRSIWLNYKISDLELRGGDAKGASARQERAVALAGNILQDPRHDVSDMELGGRGYIRLGESYTRLHKNKEALAAYEKAYALLEPWSRKQGSVTSRREIVRALGAVGDGYRHLMQLEKAADIYAANIAMLEKLVDELPKDALLLRQLNGNRSVLANMLGNPYSTSLNQPQRARPYALAALQSMEKVVEADPNNQQAGRDLAIHLNRMASMYEDSAPLEGIAYRERALALARKLSAATPDSVESRRSVALYLHSLSRGLRKLHRIEAAFASEGEAIRIRKELEARDPSWVQLLEDACIMGQGMAENYEAAGDFPAAERQYLETLDVIQKDLTKSPKSADMHRLKADLQFAIGQLFAKQKKVTQARQWFQDSIGTWGKVVALTGDNGFQQKEIAQVQRELKKLP